MMQRLARAVCAAAAPRAAARSYRNVAAREFSSTAPSSTDDAGTRRGTARTLTAVPRYPFASGVVTRMHRAAPADSLRAPSPNVKHPSRGVIPRVNSHLAQQLDPNEEIARLFSRRSEACIPPGSIVQVESWINATKTSFSTFSGVLLAVRRSGVATSFVLRNNTHKLGVEARFNAYSPAIKQIRVIQRADARKGDRSSGLLRTRRAKPYYMRHRIDRRVNSVASIVKQFKAAEARREQAGQAGAPETRAS